MAPDVTIYGKAVGGGFPVGAIGGSAEVMAPRVPERGTASATAG